MFLDSRYVWAGVGLILESADNRIVMNLRDNDPNIKFPSHWSIPTGKVEEMDFRGSSIATLEQALRREIGEELFVRGDDGLAPLSQKHFSLFCYKKFMFPGDDKFSYQFAFAGKLWVPFERLEVREGIQIGLFSRQNINGLLIAPTYRDIVELYFSRNGHR